MNFVPRNLSSSIEKIARTAVGKDWPLYATLLEHWAEIVGDDYAEKTTPVKIALAKGKKTDSGKPRGGTLTIRIPQGLTMAFSYSLETVRSRINGFFGFEAIEKIVFEPFYAAAAPPLAETAPPMPPALKERLKNDIETIENNELKDALEKLGEQVWRQS